MQSRLFKNPNFPSLLWIGKNEEIYAPPDQHFKIQMLNLWMSWENLCPNLSFTVENKMENSHKRRWSHFKLNLFILHVGCLWILLNENLSREKREKNYFFCKLNIKDGNVFYTDIYTITTIKIFTCSYIKKVLKNVYDFLIKLLATTK